MYQFLYKNQLDFRSKRQNLQQTKCSMSIKRAHHSVHGKRITMLEIIGNKLNMAQLNTPTLTRKKSSSSNSKMKTYTLAMSNSDAPFKKKKKEKQKQKTTTSKMT